MSIVLSAANKPIILSIILLNVVMLSVVAPAKQHFVVMIGAPVLVVMLTIVMLSDVMLNVIMLSATAPNKGHYKHE